MGAHRREATQPGGRNDAGFSIIESVVAITMIGGLLLGMLGTLASGSKVLITSRQRTVATALANEVLERARSMDYTWVGHDLDSDATLVSDSALVPTGPSAWTFGGEQLSGSSINGANHPFNPHVWTQVEGGVTYTVKAYVTAITPLQGDAYKRVTVLVSWDKAQFGTAAIANNVRLATFLYAVEQPPDPLLQSVSDADGGVIRITGTLLGTTLNEATFWFPSAHGEIDSRFIRRVSGYAGSPHIRLQMNSSPAVALTGCEVTGPNTTSECRGVKAESVADNDGGTAPAEHDAVGPILEVARTVGQSTTLSMAMGGNSSALSKSSSAACNSCFTLPIGDADGLPYDDSDANGPASLNISYDASGTRGSIVSFAGSARSRSIVDRDSVSGAESIVATSTTSNPALTLFTFTDAVSNLLDVHLGGYSGLVKVSSTSMTATAAAGQTSSPPSLSGSNVGIQIFRLDATGTGTYDSYTITPGVAQSSSTSSTVRVQGNTVTMEATVESRPKVVRSTSSGGVTSSAHASVTNWLTITSRLRIASANGTVLADLNIDLDYGRLHASAAYAPGA